MWAAVESGGGAGVPCARGKHAAALLGTHLYLLAGRGAGGALPLRDFWRYSLAECRWEQVPCHGDVPPALQEHTMTVHGTRLYVFGGEAGSISTETPLWVYDTETQEWRKLTGQSPPGGRRRSPRELKGAAVTPRGRRGHSAHALRDCLLIYGGYKDLRGSTNELWAFHYETETWQQVRTATAGPARHRHAAALHGARLYVHGGAHDLHDQHDLWHYDTISRVWTCVRTPARTSPPARSGHAGLRAGAHLYIFGGEVAGHLTNDLWRFHFATETWERIETSLSWPCPRVDCRALLIAGAAPRTRSAPACGGRGVNGHGNDSNRAEPPASLLREISKLSSFHIRRAARCSYSVLAAAPDSTESIPRGVSKSLSAHAIEGGAPRPPSPTPADPAPRPDMSREPLSMPDFANVTPPRLVCLDSDDERDTRTTIAKSASVRFAGDSITVTTEEEAGSLSTSDYVSVEKLSGFSNPHYLGPDVRRLGRTALTPDSGLDIELEDLALRRTRQQQQQQHEDPQQLHILIVGGREPPHVARLHCPLAMWTYRLL